MKRPFEPTLIVFWFLSFITFSCSKAESSKDIAGDAKETGDSLEVLPDAVSYDDHTTSNEDVMDSFTPLDEGTSSEDLFETQFEDVPKEKRLFTYKVIMGVSMGANAVTIASHYPDRFDVIGAMGGYVDFRYLTHVVAYFLLGGFCPMEQILDNLDSIDDPTNPNVFCGPVKPTMPYEWEWSFNKFHYDNSGGHWGREFYFDIIEGFQFAAGNMLYNNEEHPLLPPGISLDWWNNELDKCAHPAVVSYPYNINKEYNPEGKYNLITFCDGDTVECDESSLECLEKKGAYEPDKPHHVPVRFLLAVDYNGNMKRDYGEPVVVNAMERFEDVGTDGCPDPFEDGKGGCSETRVANQGDDPNHDNFDLMKNPGGTEGDFEYEEGEPFEDFGLDGVPETVSGFKDYGEGDGVFTMHPNLEALFGQDARTFFRRAPLETLKRMTFYFDGGIRDAIHAIPVMMHLSNALKLRGIEVREYDDFTATDNSILPCATCDDYITRLKDIDVSPRIFGRNIFVRYGDPNASEQAILQGDGKHVGLVCQILNRVATFIYMALNRLPNPIIKNDGDIGGTVINTSLWSDALQNRVRYSVALPPGYDYEENKDEYYPLVIFLPGHGVGASDMIQSSLLFSALMGQGVLPRFILLAPEGQCCYVHKQTGQRFCGCEKGGKDCLDNQCKGPHETCAIADVSSSDLVQECNGGHFFMNHKTNRWGDLSASEVMRFEDALFDIISDVEAKFRVRQPEYVEVPVGF